MVFPGYTSYKYYPAPLPARCADEPAKKLRVICVGAGIAGITTAIRLPQKFGKLVDLQIYDRNTEVGGTWLLNVYPGVACDIPAHTYTWSFEDNPEWSNFYAKGGEILEYVQRVAKKYKVAKYIKLQHEVISAKWNEDSGTWSVKIRDLVQDKIIDDYCNIFLQGTGALNAWDWPKIPGVHEFKGEYMHSAQYNPSFDATGKRVAIVGGGSSGIQILPKIQPVAERVDHYMRSQNWLAPAGPGVQEVVARGAMAQGNFEYPEHEKEEFRKNPEKLHAYRIKVEEYVASFSSPDSNTIGTEKQLAGQKLMTGYMEKKLTNRPQILKTLKPNWPPGCRRLTPGAGYLDALSQDNCVYISDEIERITETGILGADGTLREVDAIIYATGFITDWKQRFEIIGRDGLKWEQVMDPEPESYMGFGFDKMPNLFFFVGPNGLNGAIAVVLMIESILDYVIQIIDKMIYQDIKSICPKTDRVKQYTAYTDKWLRNTIFGAQCKTWFKRNDPDGRNIVMSPGNLILFKRLLSKPRWEDFDYTIPDELEGNPLSGYYASGYMSADLCDGCHTDFLKPENIDYPPIPEDDPEEINGASQTNGVHETNGANGISVTAA